MSGGARFRIISFCIAAGVSAVWGASPARGGSHPRLLIAADDVPRLRHACGVEAATATDTTAGRAGSRASEFLALRGHFTGRQDVDALPGELTAAAFLHVVEPNDPADGQRLALVNHALRKTDWVTIDALEVVLALDWCWDALDPDARREFLLNLRKVAEPLAAGDSPLDHRVFARKLVGLAAALAVDEEDDSSPTWESRRRELLEAGRRYFETTFPTFLAWRGRAPTSPTSGPWEECDTALAVELAGQLLQRDVWAEQREGVGRWLEHYVYASFSHPALQQGFVRDDGNLAPLTPAPDWTDLLPVTAHLIAARTQDPAAVFIARRVEQRLRGPAAEPLAVAWQWVPIALEARGLRGCDFSRLPMARNFGGAVALRGDHSPQGVGIWIEAGQPWLRRGQHFDAGHFLIYCGGQLTVTGGDDVALEAVLGKGGAQHLGRKSEPFAFEQYAASTLAHNCLLLWDPLRTLTWHGQPYEPGAGQRLVEGTCTDFSAPLEGGPRQTARQIAYGQADFAAYLALDLMSAYDSRAASGYTREFVFLANRALVVIDRVAMPHSRAKPVWVVNIPARPTVDGDELTKASQTAGGGLDGGIWNYDAAHSLRWTERDGNLWMRPLLPDPKRLAIVGGPAAKLVVSDGSYAGRTYVGGDADSFERLVRAVSGRRPQNAWYRLGQPTVLGPAFGSVPHWGRIEVQPAEKGDECVFVTVFVADAIGAGHGPSATLDKAGDDMTIALEVHGEKFLLRVPSRLRCGGAVEFETGGRRWALPSKVEPDEALPVETGIAPPG